MGQLCWPFIAQCGKAAQRSRDRSRAPSFPNALGRLDRGRLMVSAVTGVRLDSNSLTLKKPWREAAAFPGDNAQFVFLFI